jgi:NAD(P)-dependent dehydrogenase (short-subunit alcohol dehydrogenase family)
MLNGKIALVTGGGRSLGRDISLRLAEAGADVVVTYRSDRASADATVAELRGMGRRAAAVQVDLDGTDAIGGFVAAFAAQLEGWGADGFDILVNNAGISSHGALGQVDEASFDQVYRTNFKSVFFLTQALAPRIRDGGRVFTVGSGLTRFTMEAYTVYAALKAAVEHLVRSWAKTLGPRGITVNAVSPGALDTDFNRQAFDAAPQIRDVIAGNTALGRVGLAEDVGGVVAFLCSDDARWITGQRLEVSGGMFL